MFQYYTWAARIYRFMFKYLKSLSFIPRCRKKTREIPEINAIVSLFGVYLVSRGDFSFKRERKKGGWGEELKMIE